MIKLFFQIKTFLSANKVYFIKTNIFSKNFFLNLVLQQMNNHSHRRCYVEKGELKTSSNFTGEHPCRSFFLIKLLVLGLQIYYRERPQHICFTVKFAKLLRTPILKNICERLPLYCQVLLI